MLDGKANKYMSGGNAQREGFKKSALGGSKGAPAGKGGKAEAESETKGDGSTTTITHNGDGSHSVMHADGEKSEHPNTGHMLMTMHAKHSEGPGMHAHQHEAGVTTHHVGHDGMVEGPHEHGSADEAGEHMKQMLGDDGGNGAVEQSDGMQQHGGMPALY